MIDPHEHDTEFCRRRADALIGTPMNGLPSLTDRVRIVLSLECPDHCSLSRPDDRDGEHSLGCGGLHSLRHLICKDDPQSVIHVCCFRNRNTASPTTCSLWQACSISRSDSATQPGKRSRSR